jgi:hypothetical protein
MRATTILFVLFVASCAYAEVIPFAPQGFTITQDVMYSIAPDTLFDIMTGNILPWWDHHFSDQPKALYIEPKAGGGFFEIFDDAGHGAKHATVILVERGKTLRMDGPLGLSGLALQMVSTWQYESAPGGTKLTLTVNLSGQVDEEKAQLIAKVWNHFLVEQLKPYVESGTWRKR